MDWYVFIPVVIATLIVFYLFSEDSKRRQKRLAAQEELMEWQRKAEAKIREWQRRVDEAKHLLTGTDWRDPAGKAAFVGQLYEEAMPAYLWYAIGGNLSSQKEINAIVDFFWDGTHNFGDLEPHNSNNPGVGVAIRVRNPKRFASEITVGGQSCPLYQIGYSHFGDGESGCVNLVHLYDEIQNVAS